MSSISRADRCARASHASRMVQRQAFAGFRHDASEGVSPALVRAARFAMQLRSPAHRGALTALKERLDAMQRGSVQLAHDTCKLQAELASYLSM